MRDLSKTDEIAAQREIGSFMRGEIKLVDIPSWMLIGKRCKHKNKYGQCNQFVIGPGQHCFYHTQFNRGFHEIEKEQVRGRPH